VKNKPLDPDQAREIGIRQKVVRICALFEVEKGKLHWQGEKEPLANLVETILSHNTNDRNRDLAYDSLINRYPTWQDVHQASREELAEVIRSAGLNQQKAERIHNLLEFLQSTQGDFTADFLKTLTFDEAVEALGHLKGIGLKTLAVVMCFSLGRDIFPVDTHVHRLCRRLGFVPNSFDAVKTFQAMRTKVPDGKSYQFHLHLIQHGREICHARKPECEKCIVQKDCLYYFQLLRH